MLGGSVGAADDRVYFFLSYAHTRRSGPRDAPPDKPVRDFYRDLSEKVAEQAHLPQSSAVGFADWEIQAGRPWPRELERALAMCGVFIALYSPEYFTRSICGQEWAAFHRRELSHNADEMRDKTAILPVLWKLVEDEEMPFAARRIHYRLSGAGELYHKRGMRELTVRRCNRPELDGAYKTALAALAKRVVEVADDDPLSPAEGGILRLNPHENAFAGGWSGSDPHPVRFVIVAPVHGRLPAGADPELYGNRPEQWRPYWPENATPIADKARALGELDGYHPIVEPLGSCPDLRNGTGPTAPTVLIVDPWSAQDPQLVDLLQAFDAVSHEKPWVQLVIPWDKDRSGDGNQMELLERGLQRVLGKTRSRCWLTNPEAVAGVTTVAAFGQQLFGVIAAAERGYLRSADAHPPPGEVPDLPRFGGSAPGAQYKGGNDVAEGESDVRGG